MRVVVLLLLGVLIGAYSAATCALLDLEVTSGQGCCAPAGGCGSGCITCSTCGANVPAMTLHGLGSYVPAPISGALSHDEELSLPPTCTEIPHIPKPTLA